MGRRKPCKHRRPGRHARQGYGLREPRPADEEWFITAQPPETPEPVAETCVPEGMWRDVGLEVAGTIVFLRSYQSQLQEPDLADFAERNHRRAGASGCG
jgi:hypothetical protein